MMRRTQISVLMLPVKYWHGPNRGKTWLVRRRWGRDGARERHSADHGIVCAGEGAVRSVLRMCDERSWRVCMRV